VGIGYDGLVVNILASGTQVRGFKPDRNRRIFRAEKILSMPSVPCRRFAACKRSLNGVEKASFRQNYRTPFSPTVLPFATRSPRVVGTWRHLAASVGTSKGMRKQWQTTRKNLPRMQRARAIPGRLTGLWFLPKPAQGLNTDYYYYYYYIMHVC
jgi:hypothetical protein